ncbi:MAG: hypothetical protein QOD70_2942 [Frankiales bacterium]|jgi:hypothetical protein|nr:hypothetical protein [Frankiales bacterium]
MSQLLGFLQLSGRGGNELFVYDDCLVRASTGLLAAVTADKPLNLAALSGDLEEYRTMPPAQLVMQHPDNRMVRRLDVREATLARGRWPATGLRRLTLRLHSGTVMRYEWAGDSATRPQNHDEYASALLASAFDTLLTSQL